MAKKVLVYTASYCPYCTAAKSFLKSKKVNFIEVDVSGDAEARRQLTEKAGGRETVPQIFADDQLIGGYDDLITYYQNGGRL